MGIQSWVNFFIRQFPLQSNLLYYQHLTRILDDFELTIYQTINRPKMHLGHSVQVADEAKLTAPQCSVYLE